MEQSERNMLMTAAVMFAALLFGAVKSFQAHVLGKRRIKKAILNCITPEDLDKVFASCTSKFTRGIYYNEIKKLKFTDYKLGGSFEYWLRLNSEIKLGTITKLENEIENEKHKNLAYCETIDNLNLKIQEIEDKNIILQYEREGLIHDLSDEKIRFDILNKEFAKSDKAWQDFYESDIFKIVDNAIKHSLHQAKNNHLKKLEAAIKKYNKQVRAKKSPRGGSRIL